MQDGSRLTRRTTLALAAGAALALPLRRAGAAEVEERVIGRADAPVTMIEYASLTCPHCAHFHTEILPGLKERYIDTGKLKLVFRDFPLDQVALRAAVVAHCGGPERYGQFLDVLFENQERWAHTADPVAALKQIASLAGLSGEQVDACLADEKMIDAVLQSRLDAQQQYDVKSTPTFVIGDDVFAGSRSVDAFAEIIDPLLP